jgi:hypothetical protein
MLMTVEFPDKPEVLGRPAVVGTGAGNFEPVSTVSLVEVHIERPKELCPTPGQGLRFLDKCVSLGAIVVEELANVRFAFLRLLPPTCQIARNLPTVSWPWQRKGRLDVVPGGDDPGSQTVRELA